MPESVNTKAKNLMYMDKETEETENSILEDMLKRVTDVVKARFDV